MNGELFDCGIQTERSDIRAHVSPSMKRVFVYRTTDGLSTLSQKQYRIVPGFQPGVAGPTATGWLVPPTDILGIKILTLTNPGWWASFRKTDSTSTKGRAAVNLVVELLKRGSFPLWIRTGETSDKDIQIRGTDIFLCTHQRIQVKCDWHGGDPAKSGCLFLQRSERNPLKLI